jgi:hypothetical protein
MTHVCLSLPRSLNYKPQPMPWPLASSSISDTNPRNYVQRTIRCFRHFARNDGKCGTQLKNWREKDLCWHLSPRSANVALYVY